jgi:hypothetical protein
MLPKISTALLVWSFIASASPTDLDPGMRLAKRLEAPENTDIWVPDGNGNLVPGVMATSAPDGTPGPFDVVYQNNEPCDARTSGSLVLWGYRSLGFCNQQTTIVYGEAIKVSQDIDCSGLVSCSETHTSSIATSSSFSVNPGLDAQLGPNAIKLTAKLAASKTWIDTTSQTDSFTFTPRPGSKGHMVFFPYMQKACGPLLQTTFSVLPLPPSKQITGYDVASCGYTPLALQNGQPDGVSLTHYLLLIHKMPEDIANMKCRFTPSATSILALVVAIEFICCRNH